MPLLQDALKAMGIRTLEKEDFEADDILATLAARERPRVTACSSSRATATPSSWSTTSQLLYPNTQGVSQLKRYDNDAVIERYGIRPEQYPDVAALVGETSDNLTGIPKVGEKTAVKWLGLYGDLDGILAHADEIKGVVGQNLRDAGKRGAQPDSTGSSATCALDVVSPSSRRTDRLDSVRPLFERLEFRTLIERVTSRRRQSQRRGAAGGAPAAPAADAATPAAPNRRGSSARSSKAGSSAPSPRSRRASASASRSSTAG